MFSLAKVSAAVLALASFAQATITIDQPNIIANSTNTITWTSSDLNNDPTTFTIELSNPRLFHDNFAIKNNVDITLFSISFALPVVPADSGYTFLFVSNNNISDIFATSPTFSVQQHDANTTMPGSSSASGFTTASFASSAVPSLTNTSPAASLTPFSSAGSTGSATLSSVGSGTPASASSASTSTSSSSAAMDHIPSGSLAALIAGAIALLF